MSLKEKTLQGLSWSFIDNFLNKAITFVVGIILARLISPSEFGVIGYTTFFVVISSSFIDCGFGAALIRKKDCTLIDCSTVFYYNLAISVLFYVFLFFLAPLAESFFDVPGFTSILRVIGLTLVIGALASIQGLLLSKRIDFKTQTKISLYSNIPVGIITIIMAYNGFGVWALVWRAVLGQAIASALLWLFNDWRPIMVFSVKSFKELFGFGYKLALSSLLDSIFGNILYPIIGKNFSQATLGQYTRAENYASMFSSTLTDNIQRVSFPVLSSIQDDQEKLKSGYRKMIKSTMLITFVCMLGLASIAKPLVLILIGEQWLPCVTYLQLMCFAYMLYPLHAMNLNIILVKGRSDLFFKLEVIKKLLYIPIIFIGIYMGVIALLISEMILSFIAYFLNSYYSANMIRYPVKEQIMDVFPLLLISLSVSGLVWCITFLNLNNWLTLILQIGVGGFLTILIYEMINQENYREIKQIVLHYIGKISRRGIIK